MCSQVLVLVCGRKTCRLWDPSLAGALRPAGALEKLHANGRAVYASSPRAAADGRDAGASRAREISDELDALRDDDDAAADRLLEELLAAEAAPPPPPASSGGPENFSALKKTRPGPRFRDVALEAGDALYMPCGFWHEVSSSGGVHAAFNWWCHPPDASSFDSPYSSSFWRDDWARRERDDPLVKRWAERVLLWDRRRNDAAPPRRRRGSSLNGSSRS